MVLDNRQSQIEIRQSICPRSSTKTMQSENTDSARSHLDVSQYLEFQKRVLALFPYISCRVENFQTFSTVLVSVLLDAGSLFDSLAQTFIRCSSSRGMSFGAADSVKEFQRKCQGEKFFTMEDYRVLLEEQFELSRRALNLNVYDDDFYSYPTRCFREPSHRFELRPFKEWSSKGGLPWWNAFTALKHDRSTNLSKATLESTLLATGGAFVLLTVFHETYLKKSFRGLDLLKLFTPLYWKQTSQMTVMQPGFD